MGCSSGVLLAICAILLPNYLLVQTPSWGKRDASTTAAPEFIEAGSRPTGESDVVAKAERILREALRKTAEHRQMRDVLKIHLKAEHLLKKALIISEQCRRARLASDELKDAETFSTIGNPSAVDLWRALADRVGEGIWILPTASFSNIRSYLKEFWDRSVLKFASGASGPSSEPDAWMYSESVRKNKLKIANLPMSTSSRPMQQKINFNVEANAPWNSWPQWKDNSRHFRNEAQRRTRMSEFLPTFKKDDCNRKDGIEQDSPMASPACNKKDIQKRSTDEKSHAGKPADNYFKNWGNKKEQGIFPGTIKTGRRNRKSRSRSIQIIKAIKRQISSFIQRYWKVLAFFAAFLESLTYIAVLRKISQVGWWESARGAVACCRSFISSRGKKGKNDVNNRTDAQNFHGSNEGENEVKSEEVESRLPKSVPREAKRDKDHSTYESGSTVSLLRASSHHADVFKRSGNDKGVTRSRAMSAQDCKAEKRNSYDDICDYGKDSSSKPAINSSNRVADVGVVRPEWGPATCQPTTSDIYTERAAITNVTKVEDSEVKICDEKSSLLLTKLEASSSDINPDVDESGLERPASWR